MNAAVGVGATPTTSTSYSSFASIGSTCGIGGDAGEAAYLGLGPVPPFLRSVRRGSDSNRPVGMEGAPAPIGSINGAVGVQVVGVGAGRLYGRRVIAGAKHRAFLL